MKVLEQLEPTHECRGGTDHMYSWFLIFSGVKHCGSMFQGFQKLCSGEGLPLA